MGNVKEKIVKFMKTDNPQELAEKIPGRVVIFLLSVPAILFIFSMVLEFFKCLIFHENTYNIDINWINIDAAIVGVFAVAAYFLKLHYGKGGGKTVLKNPTVICFAAMIVLMFLSTLINGFTDDALMGDIYRKESLFSFVIYPAIYYFVTSLIGSETVKCRLIDGLLAVSLLIAVVTLLHIAAVDHGLTALANFTEFFVANGVVAIYHQINHYSYILAMIVILSGAMFVSAQKAARQIFYLACFTIFNIVVILNDSFGAYLATFTALIFLIVFCIIRDKKPNLRTFLLLGVFVIVSLTVDFEAVWINISTLFGDILHIIGNIEGTVPSEVANPAGSSRWHIWKSTLKMIGERPLWGHGIEAIGGRLLSEAGCDRPHNEFFQYAVFFGIPTLICYVGALVSGFVNFLKHRLEASPCTVAALMAAFGYLVSSCFGNTMYYTTPLFFIMLGLADARPPKLEDV